MACPAEPITLGSVWRDNPAGRQSPRKAPPCSSSTRPVQPNRQSTQHALRYLPATREPRSDLAGKNWVLFRPTTRPPLSSSGRVLIDYTSRLEDFDDAERACSHVQARRHARCSSIVMATGFNASTESIKALGRGMPPARRISGMDRPVPTHLLRRHLRVDVADRAGDRAGETGIAVKPNFALMFA